MQTLTKEEVEKQQEALARRKRVPQKFQVTLTKNGDLSGHHVNTSYANSPHYSQHYFWEDNKIFIDELEYTGYFGSSGGNSHIRLVSLKSGREYHMFMSDFDDILQEKKFIDNKINGKFYFCKKGNSQGTRLVFE